MFIAILTYIRPIEEVDALVPDHIRFLDEHYASGLFIVSGRIVPRTGGVILIASDNRERVSAILDQDPFSIGGVSTYELVEFAAMKMQPGFRQLIEAQHPAAA